MIYIQNYIQVTYKLHTGYIRDSSPVHMTPFSCSHGTFLQFTWHLSPVHMDPFSSYMTKLHTNYIQVTDYIQNYIQATYRSHTYYIQITYATYK